MSYRSNLAARALQGVTDVTSDSVSPFSILQTRPDPGAEAFVYEFTLVRKTAVTTSTAVSVAEAVAMGGVVAGYSWDVYGVLFRQGDAGFPVVQVVFQFSNYTLGGDLGKINVAVNDAVVKSGLGDGIGAVSVLKLTPPESRYFSQQGGLAPLVVTEGKRVNLTKAGISPPGNQVMAGDVRNLGAAAPLAVSQRVDAAAAEVPWGLLLGAVMLGGAVLFMSKSMRRNGDRYKRNSGDMGRNDRFFVQKLDFDTLSYPPLDYGAKKIKGVETLMAPDGKAVLVWHLESEGDYDY